MSKIIFFLLVLFSVISCTQKSDKEYIENPTIIDFNNVEQVDRLISIRELFKNVEYLKLNTPDTIQITIAKKVLEINDKILILDKKKKLVFAFDQGGNYLGMVGNKGQGPGEFLEVTDVAVNNDLIFIYSRGDFKVFVFDDDLNFKKDFKTKKWGTQISLLSSGNLALYSFLIEGDDEFNIDIYNTDGRLVGKRMYVDRSGQYQAMDYSGFIINDYFSYPLSSKIYKLSEDISMDSSIFNVYFPNQFPEEDFTNYGQYNINYDNKTNDKILTNFQVGPNQEFMCYYGFREGQLNGYTFGVKLSSGQTFGHLNLIHASLDKEEMDVYVKMFFIGPYNIPSYSKMSKSYWVASNIESIAYYYKDIKQSLPSLRDSDPKLYSVLSGTDQEETILMRFQLKERL
ncbi:6-bladed beta-propeller [Algoriphagus hitonicola]|uniref:6-bladed beta-propeller protein n=1 Tax=Algoriphagus hitonicola TaxID=435880 RepID=A0A1I2R7T2_9BACT|nr:6-bladed beta-propeller [Algoriphagus hitonicola]SFG33961.1 hypothetical protein SAMN04487988_1039 [Algoriphagus hitonicola]